MEEGQRRIIKDALTLEMAPSPVTPDPVYDTLYHIKHGIYEPIKRWIIDEPRSYLDSDHKVRVSTVHRDHTEMAAVVGELAMTLAPLAEPSLPNFADAAKLEGHLGKHGAEFRAQSSAEYLDAAREVMQTGTKVSYPYRGEQRFGFVQFMGNSRRGDAKFAFVGTNAEGDITTFHVESGKDFWKMLNGDPRNKTIVPVP